MKTVLISIFSGALVLGVAAAQDSTPATPPSQPQTATPGQAPQQTAPPAAKQPEPSQAPQPAASENAANAPKRIAVGSVIPVSLTKTIDAKKAKTGEEVVAKVTQDMKTTTGEVLVPKDTRIVGHVTEAQARSVAGLIGSLSPIVTQIQPQVQRAIGARHEIVIVLD